MSLLLPRPTALLGSQFAYSSSEVTNLPSGSISVGCNPAVSMSKTPGVVLVPGDSVQCGGGARYHIHQDGSYRVTVSGGGLFNCPATVVDVTTTDWVDIPLVPGPSARLDGSLFTLGDGSLCTDLGLWAVDVDYQYIVTGVDNAGARFRLLREEWSGAGWVPAVTFGDYLSMTASDAFNLWGVSRTAVGVLKQSTVAGHPIGRIRAQACLAAVGGSIQVIPTYCRLIRLALLTPGSPNYIEVRNYGSDHGTPASYYPLVTSRATLDPCGGTTNFSLDWDVDVPVGSVFEPRVYAQPIVHAEATPPAGYPAVTTVHGVRILSQVIQRDPA